MGGSDNGEGRRFKLPKRSAIERDEKALFDAVDFLRSRKRGPKRLKWQHLADALGCDESGAIRKLHPDYRRPGKISAEERKWIAAKIYDDLKLLFGTYTEELKHIPNYLFYAMLGFFDVHETSIDNTRSSIEGTYKFWRYSASEKGKYVIGKWDVSVVGANPDEQDANDGIAVHVKIKQLRKARPGKPRGEENLDGYFFRIANHYFVMVREHPNNQPRCIFFKQTRNQMVGSDKNPNSIYPPNTERLTELDGFAIGLDGDELFFSPHHMQLVDDKDELAALESELDIVSEDDVPEPVLEQLEKYPRVLWSEPLPPKKKPVRKPKSAKAKPAKPERAASNAG